MARFKDFNFKLVVVEQLMYIDEKLTPQFSPAGVLKEKGLGDAPWEYAQEHDLAYKAVPEAREYFESLELSDELLAGVEELCMDGGDQVYQECAPVWDGEDDLFDITPPSTTSFSSRTSAASWARSSWAPTWRASSRAGTSRPTGRFCLDQRVDRRKTPARRSPAGSNGSIRAHCASANGTPGPTTG
ncbi:hypothetical protein ABZ678_18225 [Streptomyces hirsutus]|uniref:DUF6892 domain-containing protein n=1 Tax=Streptomyces hirsutus TaxID=35620 RepID=UPI0033CAE900